MARVIGSEAGGYATVTPTENYIGQAIQNNEANAFKYRQEQAEKEAKIAAIAKAKQDALDKQAEEDLNDAAKLDAIKAKDSGISGIDSAIVNGMNDQRQKYINATQKYRQTRDKKYLIERSTAMNNLQSITNIPTSYQKAIDGITQGVQNGTIDASELKRVTNLGDKIEKGFVVPKIENGVMTFDVFERDPKTGQLSSIAINNMKGEDLINELTPQKKFDYNKHIGEVQKLAGPPVSNIKNGYKTTAVPNVDKYAERKATELFKDQNLLDDVAQKYGIEEDPKAGYTPEQKQAIHDRYYKDILDGFSKGVERDYSEEDQQFKRNADKRAQIAANKEKAGKEQAFKPPVSVVTKGGTNTGLGIKIDKGNMVFGPTYEKGKDGPIKGVVKRDDGDYAFSIATRKDDSLNAQGLANKRAFESNPANSGQEFEPTDKDYVYSASKPTEFTVSKHSNEVNNYVRGMLNPSNGKYFQNFDEYKQYYDKYKNKKAPESRTVVKTVSTPKAKSTKIVTKTSKNDPLGLGI